MSPVNAAGAALLALPFVVITVCVYAAGGLAAVVAGWVASIVVVGCIAIGTHLLFSE